MTDLQPKLNTLDENSTDEDLNENDSTENEANEIELVSSTKVPWLLEISFSVTKILILIVALVVITLSISAKVEWWLIIIKTGLTILVLGLLGFVFNWLLGKFLVEAKVAELKEKMDAEEAEEAERLAKEQAEMETLELLQQQENEDGGLEIET